MATRNIQEIDSDIEKLTNFMETLTAVAGEGYTIRQRLEHHEKMAELLKEKILMNGGSLDE